MGKILLSADMESLIRPEMMGLDGMRLDAMDWLVPVSESAKAREIANDRGEIDEAWIVSSDDVVGINLAAAIRSDRAELPIYLVGSGSGGSDASRAKQAGITEMISAGVLRDRLEATRKRNAAMRKVSELEHLHLVPPAPASRESSAFILAFMSGSGGVGKSSACAVSAYRCTARGLKVAVIDCDFQFGDMANLMGDAPRLSVNEALEQPPKVSTLASEASEVPVLLHAPERLEHSEELWSHIDELVSACASAFDVVLINTGSNWAEGHAQILERSNCAIFMIDQRASSVRTCQHALDLCLRMGIATTAFSYALNRCERGALFSAVDIANVMNGAQVFELREGSREVEELLGAGLASDLASSKNDFCVSVDNMLSEVLP